MKTIKEVLLASGATENESGGIVITGAADQIELTVRALMTGYDQNYMKPDMIRFLIGTKEVSISVYDLIDVQPLREDNGSSK